MHPQQLEILTLLKQTLKEKGLTYKELAKGLKVSELTMKRSLTQQGLSLDRLFEICEFAGIEFKSLAGVKAEFPESGVYVVTLEEDRFFAAHFDLYLFFLGLAQTESLAKTTRDFEFSDTKAFGMARQLEKMGFLKILPKNKLAYPKGTLIKGHPKGKMMSESHSRTVLNFLRGSFEESLSMQEFYLADLSETSVIEINQQLRAVWDRLIQLGFRDMKLPESQTRSYGFYLALRPWVYSPAAEFHELKKK